MYCKNCGHEVNENAVICPHCGCQIQSFGPTNNQANNNANQTQQKSNPLAIVGFVLSFFVALAGLICSILGYNKAKNEGLEHKNLALAGIIISIVNMVLTFLFNYIWGDWLIDYLMSFI